MAVIASGNSYKARFTLGFLTQVFTFFLMQILSCSSGANPRSGPIAFFLRNMWKK